MQPPDKELVHLSYRNYYMNELNDNDIDDMLDEIHLLQEIEDKKDKEYELALSEKSKVAISTVHCLAHIALNYFVECDNECSKCCVDIKGILSNIFVTGGACRNYLVQKEINDIDIVVNTRELNKIHLLHLRKYHNTYDKQNDNELNKCILWQLYLNKFKNEEEEEFDEKSDINSYETVRDLNYILNARFINKIFIESKQLKNNVNSYRSNNFKVYKFDFINNFVYNGYNLNGQDIDVEDTFLRVYSILFHSNQNNKKWVRKEMVNIHNKIKMIHNENQNLVRKNSIQINEITDVYNGHHLAIPINIPILEVKLSEFFLAFDFTINTLIVPFYEICQDVSVNYNWLNKIQNPSESYDVMSDFKKQILTHPSPELVIKTDLPQVEFFRLIKFKVLLPEWSVDEKLIQTHKLYYLSWIGNTKWWNEEENVPKQSKGYQWFMNQQFKYKKFTEWTIIIECYREFGTDNYLKKLIKNHKIFRKQWLKAINTKLTDLNEKKSILQLLQTKGYC
eukprot:472375_1